MNALTVIMLIFVLLGALDRIIGNKFGLGAEIERGFMLLGNMSLAMIGMISLAPSIALFVSPIFEAIYNAIASTLGLITSAVSSTPIFDMLNKMDRRGIILNSAFSVSAAFLLGGHLAYTMTLDELCLSYDTGEAYFGTGGTYTCVFLLQKQEGL